MDDFSFIKKIYNMNLNDMNVLRNDLFNERKTILKNNKDVSIIISNQRKNINNLMKQQTILKNKLPISKINIVNQVSNFLLDLTNDLNSFEEEINTINKNNSKNNNTILNDDTFDKLFSKQINLNRNINFSNNFDEEKHQPDSNFNSDFDVRIPTMTHRKDDINKINNQYDAEKKKRENLNNNVINNSIDPYKLYGIDRNKPIDLQELKKKFRQYALDTHPDKNNGDSRNFNIVKNAFKELFDEYKLRQKDKQYNQLKAESQSYIQNQKPMSNKEFDKKRFDLNKFNKIYQENKIEDVNDSGYNTWINDNKFDSEDIIKDASINSGNFNQKFNQNVKVSHELTQYKSPQALFMNNENNCVELGKTKIDNYSGKTKNISFTDYKEAHTTNRIVDNNINYRQYKDLNDIKTSRRNIENFTEEELREIEIEKQKKEQEEINRQHNLQRIDNIHFDNYNRVNKLMLERF